MNFFLSHMIRHEFTHTIVVDRYDTLRTVVVPPYSMISDEQKCQEVLKFCGLDSDAQSHQVTETRSSFEFTSTLARSLLCVV